MAEGDTLDSELIKRLQKIKEERDLKLQREQAALEALRTRVASGEVTENIDENSNETEIAATLSQVNSVRIQFIHHTTQSPNYYASLLSGTPIERVFGEQRTGDSLKLTIEPAVPMNVSTLSGFFFLNHESLTSWGSFTILPGSFRGLITTMDRGGRKQIADFYISNTSDLNTPRIHPDRAIFAGKLIVAAFEHHLQA